MTDIKLSLTPLGSSTLYDALSEEAKDFLNSKVQRKFLTEFTVGSNPSSTGEPGLKLYGLPLTMAKYSELIKSILPQDPPYHLLTFGQVYETPMTILWLSINDMPLGIALFDIFPKYLSLDEYLQLIRLINYFDLDPNMPLVSVQSAVLDRMLQKALKTGEKKIAIQYKDQVAAMVNHSIKRSRLAGNFSNSYTDKILNIIYSDYPEIIPLISDIPIFNQDNKLVGLVARDFDIKKLSFPVSVKVDKIETDVIRISQNIPEACRAIENGTQINRMRRTDLEALASKIGVSAEGKGFELKLRLRTACGFDQAGYNTNIFFFPLRATA